MEMWKCHTQRKQLPIPDEDTLPFWEGCRRQRLLIQQCDSCKVFRFPPSPFCPHCLSALASWQEDPGKGDVQTYCVYHSEIAGPAWHGDLPYIVAVIRLDYSGVKMLSNLLCEDITMARIGLRVRVIFESVDARMVLPKFVPDLPVRA